LNIDVETQTGGTNEDYEVGSKASDDTETESSQAVRTPKKEEKTVSYGMTSMLAKLCDGMDV